MDDSAPPVRRFGREVRALFHRRDGQQHDDSTEPEVIGPPSEDGRPDAEAPDPADLLNWLFNPDEQEPDPASDVEPQASKRAVRGRSSERPPPGGGAAASLRRVTSSERARLAPKPDERETETSPSVTPSRTEAMPASSAVVEDDRPTTAATARRVRPPRASPARYGGSTSRARLFAERSRSAVERRLRIVGQRRPDWRAVIAGVALIVLAVVTLATVATTLTRSRAEDDATGSSTGSSRLFGATPTIDVVLDGTSLADGAAADAQWPALLERALDATIRTQASKSASFMPLKKGGPTFFTAAADIEPDSNLVVLVSGGDEGDASSLEVLSAATRAIAAVRGTAPTAQIVLVGPFDTTPTPQNLPSLLKSAAALDGAIWVDPRTWLRGSGLRRDEHPTTAGEKRIASRFEDALAPLLR